MTSERGRSWRWRLATPDDVPALVVLVRSAYRSGQGWTSERRLVEGSRTDEPATLGMIRDPRSLILLVEEEGTPIACCRLEDRGNGVAHFGTFAVDPSHQSAGLGGWLLGEAERVARERFGAHRLDLRALVQQTALVAWYERLGFVRVGEPSPFPGHPRFARPLRDDLQFALLSKPLP